MAENNDKQIDLGRKAPEAPTAKLGTALVLNTNLKSDAKVTVTKGTRLGVDNVQYSLVKRKAPESLKRITDELFEITEDVSINSGKIIPDGTVLDEVKDKDLIEHIKKNIPNGLRLEKVVTK